VYVKLKDYEYFKVYQEFQYNQYLSRSCNYFTHNIGGQFLFHTSFLTINWLKR